MEEVEENTINDYEVPLTKTKGRPKKVKPVEVEISDVKPVKKPRTEKQIEAFAKAQETVKANRAKKLEEKKVEASKLLLEKGIELPSKKSVEKIILPPAPDLEEDHEFIYLKKEKKQKPKPKKKIIVYHDSSSDDDVSSEEEQVIHIKKSKHFKSQQNKKSVIKVHEPKQEPQKPQEKQINFFCD
jgi:hypothetical protein